MLHRISAKVISLLEMGGRSEDTKMTIALPKKDRRQRQDKRKVGRVRCGVFHVAVGIGVMCQRACLLCKV